MSSPSERGARRRCRLPSVRPGARLPVPWSVQTWLPGTDRHASRIQPQARRRSRRTWPRFIADPAHRSTPRGRRFDGLTGRGGHLPDHDEWLERLLARRARACSTSRGCGRCGRSCGRCPSVDADAMCHRDLHPAEHPGARRPARRRPRRLAGSARPTRALDLVGAWHLLDAVRRETCCGSALRLQRGPVASGDGVGVPAVDGPGLVLRRVEPDDEPLGSPYARPPARRRRIARFPSTAASPGRCPQASVLREPTVGGAA